MVTTVVQVYALYWQCCTDVQSVSDAGKNCGGGGAIDVQHLFYSVTLIAYYLQTNLLSLLFGKI